MISIPEPIDINGCLFPVQIGTNQPCLIQLKDNPDYWITIFSTEALLRSGCFALKLFDYKIKCIEEQVEFVDSVISAGVRIMLNPYIVSGEKTRWTEVMLPNQRKS